jgi:hypothetical protein
VAAEVLDTTRVLRVLMWGGADGLAVRSLLTELAAYDGVHRHLVEKVTRTGTRYDLGSDDPLVGRRLPDLDLAAGTVYDRMHQARGLLLDPLGAHRLDGWEHAVDRVVEDCPDLGAPAVLLRPDGHVAWAGGDALEQSLVRWFGPPGARQRRRHAEVDGGK